ncbi:hypothetical protein EZV62_019455 [Acer yangbiense]|uniref:CCHC-type domain-containing protein n=1 Tax=Acer yangbiense TaxID=1000413 RepID=A0A5C7HBH6_9ROSI|nr:hypothetical protein EZV62_019455 [Acer yangbiense]
MELAKLYENLSLAEEDGALHECSEEVKIDGEKDVDRCLVGKVLSGKKVNREAFKGLIEQIWNPYGNVEVDLIVLEIPEGPGNISHLKFNKADFWIQIHEIPIMCMNRRIAKWLAEQIGEVVEIPSESRECWGRFLRVKVRIDISKPLKRWLRLKLGKDDEVTVVSLKYERVPEFCFACGRLGHGIKECLDEKAMKDALDGSIIKYGSWLKAPISDKPKNRGGMFGNASSSKRSKSREISQEIEGDGSVSLRSGSRSSQIEVSEASAAATQLMVKDKSKINLAVTEGVGPSGLLDVCTDRLGPEVGVSPTDLGRPTNGLSIKPQPVTNETVNPNQIKSKGAAHTSNLPNTKTEAPPVQPMDTDTPISMSSPPVKTTKNGRELPCGDPPKEIRLLFQPVRLVSFLVELKAQGKFRLLLRLFLANSVMRQPSGQWRMDKLARGK